jgi:hypothetical protein
MLRFDSFDGSGCGNRVGLDGRAIRGERVSACGCWRDPAMERCHAGAGIVRISAQDQCDGWLVMNPPVFEYRRPSRRVGSDERLLDFQYKTVCAEFIETSSCADIQKKDREIVPGLCLKVRRFSLIHR